MYSYETLLIIKLTNVSLYKVKMEGKRNAKQIHLGENLNYFYINSLVHIHIKELKTRYGYILKKKNLK